MSKGLSKSISKLFTNKLPSQSLIIPKNIPINTNYLSNIDDITLKSKQDILDIGIGLVDDCNNCYGGNTGKEENYAKDCTGECNGNNCFGNFRKTTVYIITSVLLVVILLAVFFFTRSSISKNRSLNSLQEIEDKLNEISEKIKNM